MRVCRPGSEVGGAVGAGHGGRPKDTDHERLVGLFEGRDVDHPYLADIARRFNPDQEHLALLSEPFSGSTKVSALALVGCQAGRFRVDNQRIRTGLLMLDNMIAAEAEQASRVWQARLEHKGAKACLAPFSLLAGFSSVGHSRGRWTR